MNFEECYMDRFVQRVVHGARVSDVLNEISEDLLDRLKQETDGGHLSKPNQERLRLFMEELERRWKILLLFMEDLVRAPVDTPAQGNRANGKQNCTTNAEYHGCTFYGNVNNDNNCSSGAGGVNPNDVGEAVFGKMPREVR